jgi:hypothetical protein
MAFYETSALVKAGAMVDILTFKGLLGKAYPGSNLLFVKPNIFLLLPLYYFAAVMRKFRHTTMVAKLVEFFLTIIVAIKLRNKYDVIISKFCRNEFKY